MKKCIANLCIDMPQKEKGMWGKCNSRAARSILEE
jgi:hypothetical protein